MPATNVISSSSCGPLRCPICHQTDHFEAFETRLKYGLGEAYLYAKCKCCGLLFDPDHLSPKLNYAQQEYVDLRRYLEYDANILFFAYLLTILRAAVTKPGQATLRLLEIGSGPGFILDIARFMGNDAYGIEPNHRMVEWARSALSLKIDQGYFDRNTRLEGHFDAVLATEVLEHVLDPSEFLKAIADCLGPSGVFVLTTPNSDSRELAERPDKWTIVNPDTHPLLYSERSLGIALAEAGFTDTAIFTIEGPYKSERLLGIAGNVRQGELAERLSGVWTGWACDSKPAMTLAISYLRDLAARSAQKKCSIWEGAMGRTVEYLSSTGDHAQGALLADELDRALAARNLTPKSIEECLDRFTGEPSTLFDRLPWYLGHYCYAKAICYLHRGRFAESEGSFRIARKLYAIVDASPVALEARYSRRSLQVRYHEGYAVLLAGSTGRALAIFEELMPHLSALPLNTQHDLRFNYAVALLQLGRLQEAISQFRNMLDDPAAPQHLREQARARTKDCLYALQTQSGTSTEESPLRPFEKKLKELKQLLDS